MYSKVKPVPDDPLRFRRFTSARNSDFYIVIKRRYVGDTFFPSSRIFSELKDWFKESLGLGFELIKTFIGDSEGLTFLFKKELKMRSTLEYKPEEILKKFVYRTIIFNILDWKDIPVGHFKKLPII